MFSGDRGTAHDRTDLLRIDHAYIGDRMQKGASDSHEFHDGMGIRVGLPGDRNNT